MKLCDHVYNIVVKPLKKTWFWWVSGLGPATVRFHVVPCSNPAKVFVLHDRIKLHDFKVT